MAEAAIKQAAAFTLERRVLRDGRDALPEGIPRSHVQHGDPAGATTINVPDTVGYSTPEETWRALPLSDREYAGRGEGHLVRPLP